MLKLLHVYLQDECLTMVSGIFIEDVPLIEITLAWGNFVKNYWFTLDTGFTGDLQIPTEWATELGLKAQSIETWTIADGSKVLVPQALAVAGLDGEASRVQVGIANGSPLAGIGFLTKFGCRAIVDCKYRIVTLDKP